MKKIFFIIILIGPPLLSYSQLIKSVTNRIKNKVEAKVNDKVERKLDENINKAIDTTIKKTEELITGLVTASPDTVKHLADQPAHYWGNKFLKDGQWLTEIKFDPASASFSPESEVLLKEIAALLFENAGLRIKIICLAEPGADQAEFERCFSLATMIKLTLANQFGIDQGRMIAEGKVEGAKTEFPQSKSPTKKVRLLKL